MTLPTQPERDLFLAQAQAAFPHLKDWEQHDPTEFEDYLGFTLWGVYEMNLGDFDQRFFFITFNAENGHWYGHLTIGQPYYLWSSADVGDALLLHTPPCATLPEVIATLKAEIVRFSHYFVS